MVSTQVHEGLLASVGYLYRVQCLWSRGPPSPGRGKGSEVVVKPMSPPPSPPSPVESWWVISVASIGYISGLLTSVPACGIMVGDTSVASIGYTSGEPNLLLTSAPGPPPVESWWVTSIASTRCIFGDQRVIDFGPRPWLLETWWVTSVAGVGYISGEPNLLLTSVPGPPCEIMVGDFYCKHRVHFRGTQSRRSFFWGL